MKPESLSDASTMNREPEEFPLVTAVVPVRNRRAITLRFLAQMERQTYPNLRVVVVDSNSSDGTSAAIRLNHPNVVVLLANDHAYWSGATNLGIRHALTQGSEWLLTINDDAVVCDDHVERLLAKAKRWGCHILGSQINYLAEPDKVWSVGAYTTWGGSRLLELGCHGLRSAQPTQLAAQEEVIEVDALPGNGVLLHHDVYRKIGLYSEWLLPHYHADSELVMRAVAHGIKAWVTPDIILLNDFSPLQKRLPSRSLKSLAWSIFHPKSHLYILPLLYIWLRYCPNRMKLLTATSLIRRLAGIIRTTSGTN